MLEPLAVSEPFRIEGDLWAAVDPWVRERRGERHLRLVEPLEPFFCEDCGHVFSVRPRQARAIRAGTRKQRCSFCREPREGGARNFRVTALERQYWLDRFSVEEIVEIAEFCWGPRSTWTEEWRDEFVFEQDPCPV